ncbi:MAG: hypothetical protein B0D84_02260 [Candidatus Sedimenticola endophacoides]|uniref:Uncharacterized protein n=1 Tax=Candidatus Sedimenticola endophacoides TaxID=2548426 RepID=A0A657PMU2_9GAMM|nr:MAG: hypothetical protein B0D84_02260 [Candidatus Sedimenticola endophacoides]
MLMSCAGFTRPAGHAGIRGFRPSDGADHVVARKAISDSMAQGRSRRPHVQTAAETGYDRL